MVNGIRESNPCGLNKGRGRKFRVDCRDQQETPEGRRTYRSKRYKYDNIDEKTLNGLKKKKKKKKKKKIQSFISEIQTTKKLT